MTRKPIHGRQIWNILDADTSAVEACVGFYWVTLALFGSYAGWLDKWVPAEMGISAAYPFIYIFACVLGTSMIAVSWTQKLKTRQYLMLLSALIISTLAWIDLMNYGLRYVRGPIFAVAAFMQCWAYLALEARILGSKRGIR